MVGGVCVCAGWWVGWLVGLFSLFFIYVVLCVCVWGDVSKETENQQLVSIHGSGGWLQSSFKAFAGILQMLNQRDVQL